MDEEITTRSWGSRLKDAFVGILVGFLLIIAAIVLAFWNEKNSLHTAQSLAQAQKIVVTVPPSPISEQNNLKVVYVSGLANTTDKLTDNLLGVTVNAIRLSRQADMYQWQEKIETRTESQTGGSEKQIKTYSYDKIWSDKLIDSTQFKNQQGHQNPSTMAIQSQQQYASTVKVGDFLLPEDLIKQIDISQSVDLTPVNKDELKTRFDKSVSLVNNQLYFGQDNQNPQLGDLRVSLEAVLAQNVSIIGQQTGNTLQAYMAPAGQAVMLLSTGQHSSEEMFEKAQANNRMMAWILRLASLVMLCFGFSLIMKPLVVLADVLPFLGTIVGYGTGLVAFVCGLSVWVLVTAIAWFVTRPLLSIGMVALLVVLVYWLIKRRSSKPVTPKV